MKDLHITRKPDSYEIHITGTNEHPVDEYAALSVIQTVDKGNRGESLTLKPVILGMCKLSSRISGLVPLAIIVIAVLMFARFAGDTLFKEPEPHAQLPIINRLDS